MPAPVGQRAKRIKALEAGDVGVEGNASIAYLKGAVRIEAVKLDRVTRHKGLPVYFHKICEGLSAEVPPLIAVNPLAQW